MHDPNLAKLNGELKPYELFIGHQEVPFHFSVGLVALYEGKVALIKTKWGEVRLPSETPREDETYKQTLLRLAREELGVNEIEISHYIGSTTTFFLRPLFKELTLPQDVELIHLQGNEKSYVRVEKTTAWFLAYVSQLADIEVDPEEVKEVLWVTVTEAFSLVTVAEEIGFLAKIRKFIES